MNYGNKKNEFSCLKNVWHLRRKQRVIIADHPNVRAANLLMMDVIKRNWPSQRSKRYPLGYIEFQSWKKFDYATQTIGKRPAYIFCCTHEIESYYRIKTAEQIIGDSIYNKLAEGDGNTACELLSDLVHANCGLHLHPVYERDQLLGLLHVIGLRELEDFAALLSLPDGASIPPIAVVPEAA